MLLKSRGGQSFPPTDRSRRAKSVGRTTGAGAGTGATGGMTGTGLGTGTTGRGAGTTHPSTGSGAGGRDRARSGQIVHKTIQLRGGATGSCR